ncbi:MAG: YtxH domain-containing protein [Bacteroidia bacterium]
MNSSKVLFGLLAGAAAGVTLGILFAPDKGINTRKKISKLGEDYMDNLKSKFEDVVLKAANEMEYVKSEAENLVDIGKEKVDEIKNKAGEKLSAQS